MSGVKGRSGGARKGAGRKPVVERAVPKARHTIYCTSDEFFCIKELLKEIRKEESAWKEVSKYKGDKVLHEKAVQDTIEIDKSIKSTTIGQLKERAEVAKIEYQKKKAEKEKKVNHNG